MRQATKCVLEDPYNPEFWLQRAFHLLDLGFPELAAGDARKSSLLWKAMLSDDNPFLGGIAKLQIAAFPRVESGEQACRAGQCSFQDHMLSKYISAEEVLLESLYMMNDFWETLEICKEGKAQFPGVQLYQIGFRSFKEHSYRKRSTLREIEVPTIELNYILVRGEAKFKPYPFLPTEYLHRPEQLVTDIQQTLNEETSGKCTLSNSPTLGTTKGDVLGVIAGLDVEAGTQLIRESALLVASSETHWYSSAQKSTRSVSFVVMLFNGNRRILHRVRSVPLHTAQSFAEISHSQPIIKPCAARTLAGSMTWIMPASLAKKEQWTKEGPCKALCGYESSLSVFKKAAIL